MLNSSLYGYAILLKTVNKIYEETQNPKEFINEVLAILKIIIIDKSPSEEIINFDALNLVIEFIKTDEASELMIQGVQMIKELVENNWKNDLIVFRLNIPHKLIKALNSQIISQS
jgi:tRNA isopentenyl-2-thiomethyl-A-37 hydroxylase MiaE